MSPRVLLLNGPNLNLLGEREPDRYGRATLPEVEAACAALAAELGLELEAHQSNHEGALIDRIHAARGAAAGVILNAGAYTHTSIAIVDALNAYDGPVVEVHVTQVHRRERFRHRSHVSRRADAVIAGCGTNGYLLALRHLADLLAP